MASKFGKSPADIVFREELSLFEEQLFNLFIMSIGTQEEKRQSDKAQREAKRKR